MKLARVVALMLLVGSGALGCQRRLHYGATEIIAEPSVTEAEAKAVGDYLQEKRWITPSAASTIRIDTVKELSHSPPTFRIILTVSAGAWDDKAFVAEVQGWANEIKKQIAGGRQTLILLADQSRITKLTIYARP